MQTFSQTAKGSALSNVLSHSYQLEKHPKKKGQCPLCLHENVLRYFEDQNGNRITNTGICERKNSCGYHVRPNQEQFGSILPKTPDAQLVEIIFPDKKSLSKFEVLEKDCSSNFHSYCNSLNIPLSHLIKWGVGTDKTNTIFILRNQENRVANVKYFKYLNTGKRDKEFDSYSLRQPTNKNQRYILPLYGEHLLDSSKQKIVCITESEKTAVIASWFYPHFDFVACGSANGLTAEKLSALYGRKIYWLADADKAGRDNSSIKNLKAYEQNFEIIDLFPQLEDGTDLADAIQNETQLYSNISAKETQENQFLKDKPALLITQTNQVNRLDEIINKHRVTTTNQYKPMNPVIHINDSVFGVNGDISFISGPPKVGKSTITRLIIATALMENVDDNDDTLSIRTQFCKGRKIIYLDTEQNPSDTKKMVHSIIDIAKLKKEPENLIALNFRELSHSENRQTLKELFEYFSDAYLWIIDGITDFLPSANDETVSNELIRELMKMSSIHNTCIVCLIHENGGNANGKMRGHIGSEAARKCQGAISIAYEEHAKVHSIKSTFLRGSKKIDPIFWEFNENGRPVSCSAELVAELNNPNMKDQKKTSEMVNILEKIYKNLHDKRLTIDELKKQIMMHMDKKTGVKEDSLRKSRDRLYKGMIEHKLISSNIENINGVERTTHSYNNPKGSSIEF